MRSRLWILLALTALSGRRANAEVEPNDTRAQANSLTLNASMIATNAGKINSLSDLDYFSLATPAFTGTATMTITMTPTSPDHALDASLQMQSSSGTVLTNRDVGGDNVPETIVYAQATGSATYYIVCKTADLVSYGAGDYTLQVSMNIPAGPELVASSLSWNTTNSGLDLSYASAGTPLPTNTTVKVYWAGGTNLGQAFTQTPIFTTNIALGFVGQAAFNLPESALNYPPTNATYVLMALDPDNRITESNRANNILALRNTFRHVVLVMMENRSFDHLLGWLPGAEGRQPGKTYTNLSGQSFTNRHLAPQFSGCGCDDPDHSYTGSRVEFNNGACDGWLRANSNDTFSIGYYLQNDLAFFGQIAPNWTVCDHYFAAIMSETQPNRIYQHAAQTDSLYNRENWWQFIPPFTGVSLTTIWDRLAQTNVSRRYYYAGYSLPDFTKRLSSSFLHLWGPTAYNSISAGVEQFYSDCRAGTLPSVSLVDPLFAEIVPDLGNDDHPHADLRKGEDFLASIYNEIVSGPNWSSTVLIINFDEGGGFFDHVAPPVVAIPGAEQSLGSDGRLGFRVPCLVISPWSHRSYIATEQFDHTSVLKLIENRWGLAPLTIRDANANDLAHVLDLDHPNFSAPASVITPNLQWCGCNNLEISRQPNGSVMVNWDSLCRKLHLHGASTPKGPWTTIMSNAVPPYVSPPAAKEQFFRFQLGP